MWLLLIGLTATLATTTTTLTDSSTSTITTSTVTTSSSSTTTTFTSTSTTTTAYTSTSSSIKNITSLPASTTKASSVSIWWVSPVIGPLGTSITMTITGTGFDRDCVVAIGGFPCQRQTLLSSSSITCVPFVQDGIDLPIFIQSSTGDLSNIVTFSYYPSSPLIKMKLSQDISQMTTAMLISFRDTIQSLLGLDSIDQVYISRVAAGSTQVEFMILSSAKQTTADQTAVMLIIKAANEGTLLLSGINALSVDAGGSYVVPKSVNSGAATLPSWVLIAIIALGVAVVLLSLVVLYVFRKRSKQAANVPIEIIEQEVKRQQTLAMTRSALEEAMQSSDLMEIFKSPILSPPSRNGSLLNLRDSIAIKREPSILQLFQEDDENKNRKDEEPKTYRDFMAAPPPPAKNGNFLLRRSDSGRLLPQKQSSKRVLIRTDDVMLDDVEPLNVVIGSPFRPLKSSLKTTPTTTKITPNLQNASGITRVTADTRYLKDIDNDNNNDNNDTKNIKLIDNK